MRKNIVCSLTALFVLMGVLGVSLNIHKVSALYPIIYIKADGSIDPATANITTPDSITYTFTTDINASIIIQRSNIVVDGDGWTLGGNHYAIINGLNLTGLSNVTIKNVNILEFGFATWLEGASQCVISNNNCTDNEGGIWLVSSMGNTVSGNIVIRSVEAVALDSSSYDNTISDNVLAESYYGVYVKNSSDNTISGNNVTANTNYGIQLHYSHDNTISGNYITNNWGRGIDLSASSNNTLSGNNAEGNVAGIVAGSALVNSVLVTSRNNTIVENNIVNNANGVDVVGVLFTTISRNHVAENSQYGITLDAASNNIISENDIQNNTLGVYYDGLCDNNTAYHNNFIDNTKQVEVTPGDVDAWDDGVEGNYWGNYTGADLNHDGIGDSPHIIDSNNIDNYPLMGMFHRFNTSLGKSVNVISNSTVDSFQYESPGTIRFQVSNTTANQAHGFCRVSIPYEVLSGPFNVTIDGANPTYWNYTLYDNGTHNWIYFEYQHSMREIVIIPEVSSLLLLPLLMTATLLAATLYRRKKSQIHKPS